MEAAQGGRRDIADHLSDTYHAERHPVAARVLRNTMAQVALMRPDDRIEALRESVTELLSMDEPRKRFAAMMSGLDIHYDLGEGHPLLGRRMPISTWSPPTARCGSSPCCTMPGRCCSTSASLALRHRTMVGSGSGGRRRLRRRVGFRHSGRSLLPAAVVIRPDGYVAWVGDRARAGLCRAHHWFGPPAWELLDDPAADGVDRRLDAVLDLGFMRMFEMWFLTVLVLMNSSRAISALSLPMAIAAGTSAPARKLGANRPRGGHVRGLRPEARRSFAAMWGEISDSARSRADPRDQLVDGRVLQQVAARAAAASITSSSSTEIVRTTTRVRAMPVSWRVVSTPVRPGMFRSMTTTSGASRSRGAAPPGRCRPRRLPVGPAPRGGCEAAPEEIVVVDEKHAQVFELLLRAPILGG